MVYNEGLDNVIDGSERSCLYHWDKSLHIHTREKYVNAPYQDEHKQICQQWHCIKTVKDTNSQYHFIHAWWANDKVANANLLQIDCWLS